MIYDCFTFLNENALLEIRLNTLRDIVDKFVIVEANKTFVGEYKPKLCDEILWQDFADKVLYVYLEDMPEFSNPWAYENYQRNYILDILKTQNCSDEDIIIVSDLDEIPSVEGILEYQKEPEGIKALSQNFYNYYLNLLNCSESPWWKAKIFQYKEFFNKDNEGSFLNDDAFIQEVNKGVTPTSIRLPVHKEIKNGGWHFSYMGGAECIKYKIENFAHQEFNLPHITDLKLIENCLENNKDVLGRDLRFRKVEFDDSFPPYLIQNIDKFKDLIL